MTCRARRYALADDIKEGDPHFLHRVDQLALEIHVPREFASSDAHVAALGRLAAMMSAASLELASVHLTPCAPPHEAAGCHEVRRAAASVQPVGDTVSGGPSRRVWCSRHT